MSSHHPSPRPPSNASDRLTAASIGPTAAGTTATAVPAPTTMTDRERVGLDRIGDGSELLLIPTTDRKKDFTIRLDDVHSDADHDDGDGLSDFEEWGHHDIRPYPHNSRRSVPGQLADRVRKSLQSWSTRPRLLAIVGSLTLVILTAAFLSRPSAPPPPPPLTLLISIDGFRPDYFTSRSSLTPHLHSLLSSSSLSPTPRPSVHAKHLRPSFPTITFPNHYTLVTGLLPSQHGIVSNAFYDPALNASFLYTSPESNADPRFWNRAEPLWITAERQGLATGVVHWPGNEAAHDGRWPSLWMRYKNWGPSQRVALVMHWLDPRNVSGRVPKALVPSEDVGEDWSGFPGRKRAQWPAYPPPAAAATAQGLSLVALYIPQVDQAGHKNGPDSAAVNQTIAEVDAALGDLFAFLKATDRWDTTNVVVVSDHGMAKAGENENEAVVPAEGSSNRYRISLREALGRYHDVVVVRDRWPIVMLDPVNPQDTMPILRQLQLTSTRLRFRAFHRDALPPELRYGANLRIPPIVVIPDNDLQFEDLPNESLPMGMHGYDLTTDALGEMRAVFLASGPAFAAAGTGETRVVDAFDNVEVYGILCKVMGIHPEQNAGTGVEWLM
ncbi:alkaline-phosphatase-like protein [Catenaria anguillulae PL171]|uniref:Alkaline-phosphatase-like protein n=1 Tax=Catenaria anguillulae PL171 TaxID=765915 RepID=A0A1Y2HMH4_9FUNG|nr:alkaline-phosphatase-like protein [Catenaria anguillulae PL171]